MDMDQVLADEQPNATEVAPVEAVEQPTVEAPQVEQSEDLKVDATGRVHASDGKFAPKPNTGETNAAAEQTVPLAALTAERAKRQALEQQLQKSQPQNFWEDPEATVNQIAERTQRLVIERHLESSEYRARRDHPDFEEKAKVFAQLLNEPGGESLKAQAINHPDPADFVYQVGANFLQLKQVGSVDKLRQQIEAEVRAKVEAEVRRKVEEEAKRAGSLTQTLSDVNGATTGGLRDPAWTGPTPLDAFLSTR